MAVVSSAHRVTTRTAAALWAILVVACLWVLTTLALGGFVVDLGPLHVASRSATRAITIASAFALLVALVGCGLEPMSALRRRRELPLLVALVAALVPITIGLEYGTFVAGGADSYGYVSQSDLWRSGRLHVSQPLAAQLPWANAQDVLSPLGYRPNPDGTSIVPTYAPGLPLLMAGASMLAGTRGPFLIGPLAAGLTVLLTFSLGRRWYSDVVGLAAAGWLALSPSFLYQSLWPMSDIPATCLTVAAAWLTNRGGPAWIAARAMCVFLLVLVRPNLALVALALAAWPARGTTLRERRGSWMAAFAGLLGGGATIALLQWHLYGAPWRSGYGSAEALYALAALWPNLTRYPVWLVQQQSPLIVLALVPLLSLVTRRQPGAARPPLPFIALVIGAVWLSYLFYAPFEEWWYLRFMLPSLPFLLVLSAATLAGTIARLRLASGAPALVAWVAWVVVAAHYARQIDDRHMLDIHREEARYAAVGAFVDRRLPANAVVLTSQHSGSVRYYGHRLTARWDSLPPGGLREALGAFEAQGLHPFFALDDWEEPVLLQRLAPTERNASVLGAIIGEWRDPGLARVYDPAMSRSVTSPERIFQPGP